MPPPEFLKKGKDTQRQGTKEFLSTLLNQDLEPNYRPKSPCSCCPFSELANGQEASRPVNSREEHYAPLTNIFTSVRMTQTYNRPRRQQKQKKEEIQSDCSTDSDDTKYNQDRKKPIRHDIASDLETEIEDDQDSVIEAPLRRPNTMPKVLNSRIKIYLLSSWTSVN